MRKVFLFNLIFLICLSFIPTTTAVDKGTIIKVVKVHFKKAQNQSDVENATVELLSGESSPTYLYDGVHWANPVVSYKVSANGSSLGSGAVTAAVNSSFDTWENETNNVGRLDNSNIDFIYDSSLLLKRERGARFNGMNTVSWGKIGGRTTIAQTTYWYYSISKELVEFDIVMNNSRGFNWSTTGDANAFDVQNIATHEAGHTLVLLDLYDSQDSRLTMYGYSSLGETNKRDLGLGDCLGVEHIYPVQ